jgi:hypothetical protein
MTVLEESRAALDLKTLSLPPGLPVTRLEVEDYTDADGEPALRVLAVIEESVVVEQVNGRDVVAMKSAIRDSLRQRGITLFPYVFIAKQSELDEEENEEENERRGEG